MSDIDGLTSAVGAVSLDDQVHFAAPAAAKPVAAAGTSQDDDTVVDDLTTFLAEQPAKSLRGVFMASFYLAYPHHKGRGLKLKALATAHPDRLRWVPGPTPAEHRCCLAGTPVEEATPACSDAADSSASEPSPPPPPPPTTQPMVPAGRIAIVIDLHYLEIACKEVRRPRQHECPRHSSSPNTGLRIIFCPTIPAVSWDAERPCDRTSACPPPMPPPNRRARTRLRILLSTSSVPSDFGPSSPSPPPPLVDVGVGHSTQ